MLRSIKIRLYPNKIQECEFNKILNCYRFVYNHMLGKKKGAYEQDKTNLGLCKLSKYFHNILIKDENYFWLKEQNTHIMKGAIRQMLDAYNRFFKQHTGFPRFKSKKDKQSSLFPLESISKKNTFNTKHISLTKSLKNVKFRCSDLYLCRLQKYSKNIRSATLSKTKTDKFFLSILIDMQEDEYNKFEHTDYDCGIDLGVKDFVITSDGDVFENKHFYKKEEKKIAKLQRQLSKKKKGSNNFNKQCKRIAVLFERMTNKKENYIHSVSNDLLKKYDTIFMEDLNTSGMMKNRKLSKAIQEVGFFKFKTTLKNKALQNNKKVIEIDRYYPSSKTCSKCGYINKDLKLSDRYWTCPKCGEALDRDINAAINILYEGRRLV